MRIQIISGFLALCVSASSGLADPMSDIVARLNALEKRNDDLANENASLKQRVAKLESASTPAMAQADHSAISTAEKAPTVVTTAAVVPTSARIETSSIDRVEPREPRFTWTGAYVGVHGGGAWGDLDYADTIFTETFRDDLSATGGLGGVQIGANKQFGNWVAGGELSVSGARISGTDSACHDDPLLGLDAECEARVNWLVTGLARLGYAHDRWLLSAAAGWSVAGADYVFTPDFGPPISFASSETLSGFTYGAGFNYALTPTISLGMEYLRANLEAHGPSFLNPFAGGTGERELDLNIARAQLNVKLGD